MLNNVITLWVKQFAVAIQSATYMYEVSNIIMSQCCLFYQELPILM